MPRQDLSDTALQSLVTASLLRWGADTKAQRAFKELRQATSAPVSTLVRPLGQAIEASSDRRAAAEHSARAQARTALGRAAVERIRALVAGDGEYPSMLGEIVDPPIVLWVGGETACLRLPAVAVVGSRRATPAGLGTARRLARDLARAGLIVVSGLAQGIDAAAHQGALDGGGPTVAVLGSGVDVVYPRTHERLAASIRENGCVLSELPPGAPPLPRHFPLRNRIISGLSRAVVVVEAAERSGSLITARMALEQGRDVLAVPGPVVSGCHRGCHALIKDGAGLVETADDVLQALGWNSKPPAGTGGAVRAGVAGLMVPGVPISLDDLATRAAGRSAAVLAELGVLEVQGVVARMAGGLFVRLD